MTRVLGVDACMKGWVGITSDLRGYVGSTIDELVADADTDGTLVVVAVDIPIGLPVTGSRQADVLARRLVGKRRSSVFQTPVRAAIVASSYEEANTMNVQATGKGLSRQMYALRRKVLDVDAWVRADERTVIEVHPEVCFATMAGHTLEHPKSTWAGVEERRHILATAEVDVPSELGAAGRSAAVDDVLDAAAASWTAARYASGAAVPHPATPERFDDGPAAAIWA